MSQKSPIRQVLTGDVPEEVIREIARAIQGNSSGYQAGSSRRAAPRGNDPLGPWRTTVMNVLKSEGRQVGQMLIDRSQRNAWLDAVNSEGQPGWSLANRVFQDSRIT